MPEVLAKDYDKIKDSGALAILAAGFVINKVECDSIEAIKSVLAEREVPELLEEAIAKYPVSRFA